MTNVDRTLLAVTSEFKREGFSVRVKTGRWGRPDEYIITHKTESPRWRMIVKACRTTAEAQEYKDWAKATPDRFALGKQTKESHEAIQRHYQRQPRTMNGTNITLMFDKRRRVRPYLVGDNVRKEIANWGIVYDMPEDTVYDTPEGYRKAIGVGGTAKDVRAAKRAHYQAIRQRDTYVKSHATELLAAVDTLVNHAQAGFLTGEMVVQTFQFAALRDLAKRAHLLDGAVKEEADKLIQMTEEVAEKAEA